LIVCSLADKFTFQRFISHVRATEIQQFRRLCFSSISIVRPALLAYTCLVLTLHKIVGSLAYRLEKMHSWLNCIGHDIVRSDTD